MKIYDYRYLFAAYDSTISINTSYAKLTISEAFKELHFLHWDCIEKYVYASGTCSGAIHRYIIELIKKDPFEAAIKIPLIGITRIKVLKYLNRVGLSYEFGECDGTITMEDFLTYNELDLTQLQTSAKD